MALDSDKVKKIAHLARLAVTEEEIPKYAEDLNKVLSLVEKMSEVETDDVAPLAHPVDICQRLRADTVTETDQREHFQELAPAVEEGLYLVPKVIE
ncbi:Aspartyl-tRNA(Asn) amidotransferase subunit C @ Glutamyl-tRNA(Gln) amidotransferase subunit C [hydrothermal vent metagenome]|uniref:Aspartyl-tRNA(Asn) amidotransferase subunit C @ Glutamyl-tRNA(Gln) amidotransferase subunit C n=1 Tax=hydrothermal vent metagenome TaxID=652676 RepID=A0A3B0ZIE2_9ZZZZ